MVKCNCSYFKYLFADNFFFYLHTAIFLGSLKLPHTEVKKLILKCDQVVLKESAINSLLKYLPSPEQVRHKTNNQTNKIRWNHFRVLKQRSYFKVKILFLLPNFHIFSIYICENFVGVSREFLSADVFLLSTQSQHFDLLDSFFFFFLTSGRKTFRRSLIRHFEAFWINSAIFDVFSFFSILVEVTL